VRCPVAHAWYARDGDEFDDAIDALRVDGEPLDARERLQLHLLNERARSDVDKAPASDENLVQISRARYVLSLPGAELVNALPIGWSDEDIERRLRGDLLSRTRATLARIHAVADAIARSRSKAFGDADDAFFVFSVDDLKWAHAVFWSRAMTLRFPRKGFTGGGDVDALVPLVDMCNHRAGSTATLEIVEDDAGDAFYELRAGVATKAGDEVFINYGAKGNEELLRCHGFVIPNNPCDVLAVDLRKLWLWKGDVHWRGDVAASEAEAEAALRERDLPTRAFLHRAVDGDAFALPDAMISAARSRYEMEDPRPGREKDAEKRLERRASAAIIRLVGEIFSLVGRGDETVDVEALCKKGCSGIEATGENADVACAIVRKSAVEISNAALRAALVWPSALEPGGDQAEDASENGPEKDKKRAREDDAWESD